ncbi:AMP-binding protein, partial [Streptomyces sp. HSW2009]|uniref:AMP-binding protein n=1 Tax=Streptomyces sp. HSW2009 TaxID=3142890 RepID=UPI0032ED4C51
DVLLAVTTVGFDIAGLELFGPLVVGGCVVVVGREVVRDVVGLCGVVVGEGVSVMQGTPSLWRGVLGAVESGVVDGVESGGGVLSGVRVLVGGEVLPVDVARGLVGRAERVVNVYGPTETTIWSTAGWVEGVGVPGIGGPVA